MAFDNTNTPTETWLDAAIHRADELKTELTDFAAKAGIDCRAGGIDQAANAVAYYPSAALESLDRDGRGLDTVLDLMSARVLLAAWFDAKAVAQ